MIPSKLSNKILYIGTDPDGKGGIATVIKSCSGAVESFRYICSHKFAGRFTQMWLALSAAVRTAWLCAFGGIEIVHIHTSSYRAFFRESVYLLIAKTLGRKVILQLHGGEFEIFYGQHPQYCNYICRKADVLVGVSEYFGNMFRRLGLNENIVVVFNSVGKPLYERKTRSDNNVRVLFMGAIDRNKGIFDVLECLAGYRERFENTITLDICGIGEDERLCRKITDYKLEAFVNYRGWVGKEEKNRLLASADIYIQPSYFESFGIAVVEAMSYGIPVIASETGGIPEIVKHGVNGFLINPGNMESFAEYLTKLVDDSGLRNEMSEACLATAALFTPENMERELSELYKSLLQS